MKAGDSLLFNGIGPVNQIVTTTEYILFIHSKKPMKTPANKLLCVVVFQLVGVF